MKNPLVTFIIGAIVGAGAMGLWAQYIGTKQDLEKKKEESQPEITNTK